MMTRRPGRRGIALLLPALLGACAGAPDRPHPVLDRDDVTARLVYPAEALRRHLEGEATFRCTVTPAGRAEGCRLVAATDPVFVAPAAAFLAQAPFLPATQDGRPVATPGFVEHVGFHLSHATDANPFL